MDVKIGNMTSPIESSKDYTDELTSELERVKLSADGRDCEAVNKTAPSAQEEIPTHLSATTGYLHCLTFEQETKLFQLWGMLSKYFNLPLHNSRGRGKTNESAHELYSKVIQEFNSGIPLDGIYPSEAEMSEIDSNPSTNEFFFQCAFDDPDRILLRYLRARKWNVPEAFRMLTDCLLWRHSFDVQGIIRKGDFAIKQSILNAGKNYIWKADKAGRLPMFVRTRLHHKNGQTLKESDVFTTYSIELFRILRCHEEQLATIIFDLKDSGLGNADLGALQIMIAVCQNYYPELLGKCLVKDAPWIFKGIWKMIQPLLDPVVAAKIDFVDEKGLLRYFDQDALPLEYGGTDPFVFMYHPPTEADRPTPLSEAELSDFEERKKDLRWKLIAVTREHSFALCASTRNADQESLSQIKGRRDILKSQLKECYQEYFHLTIPKNNYHRLGVMNDSGRIDWDGYNRKKALMADRIDRRPGPQLS